MGKLFPAARLTSTFATFGVRGFIAAFISLPLNSFLKTMQFTVSFQKADQIQKGKRQSIAALHMTWQKSS